MSWLDPRLTLKPKQKENKKHTRFTYWASIKATESAHRLYPVLTVCLPIFYFFIFWVCLFPCFESGSHYGVQVGLKLQVLGLKQAQLLLLGYYETDEKRLPFSCASQSEVWFAQWLSHPSPCILLPLSPLKIDWDNLSQWLPGYVVATLLQDILRYCLTVSHSAPFRLPSLQILLLWPL